MVSEVALSRSNKEFQLHTNHEMGDLIISYLEHLNIDYVFGIPGGPIEPFYNALARGEKRGGPKAIIARHENGATFMATGYTQVTGKIGVCCATTGPGSTNLITGVAQAYENNLPMLVITAQAPLPNLGKGAVQDSSCSGINTVGMFDQCTLYSTFVSHVDQLETKLIEALVRALTPPFGPVHLSIPADVLRSPATLPTSHFFLDRLLAKREFIDPIAIDQFYHEVKSGNSVIVVGERCTGAVDQILETATLLNAPVVTMPHAKGLINSFHPMYRGAIGFCGHSTARDILIDTNTNHIIAVGTPLSEPATDTWNPYILNERLIHIDDSSKYKARSKMGKLYVEGDIQATFRYLNDKLKADKPIVLNTVNDNVATEPESGGLKFEPPLAFQLLDEEKRYSEASPIKPQRLMRELPHLLPEDTTYYVDVGNAMAWALHYLHPYAPQPSRPKGATIGSMCSFIEFGTMGWAIGASIGAALGEPNHPVVCVTGDGAMLMSGQEFTVAVQHKVPMIFIVLNDAAFGMVKHGQRLGGGEPIGFELPKIDFCLFARMSGAAAHAVNSIEELQALDFKAMMKRGGPTLIDVQIDPEETPPIGSRIWALTGQEPATD